MTDAGAGRVTRIGAYTVCVERSELLLVRLNEETTAAGLWTLPGGGIEFGEHPEVAALRELEEETGYTGRLAGLLLVDSYSAAAGERFAHAFHGIRVIYRCEIIGGDLRHEPIGNTSDEARWWPLDELTRLGDHAPLVPLGRIGLGLATTP